MSLKSQQYTYDVCSKSIANFEFSLVTYNRISIFYVGTLLSNICTKFEVYSIFCIS